MIGELQLEHFKAHTLVLRSAELVEFVEEAEAEVSQFQASPSGRIVVSASGLFGRIFLAPVLSGFLERHPRISIELPLTDRFVNLVEEGVDVAVRVGGLADSSLVARRIGGFRRVVCASPRYLKRHGAPKQPADVTAHDCLVFEDAPLGVEAARRAGMDAVALTTTLPAAAFAPYPNLRLTMADFVGFDLQTLTPRDNSHA